MFDDIEVGLFEVAWCWKVQHLKTTSIFVSAGRKRFHKTEVHQTCCPFKKDWTFSVTRYSEFGLRWLLKFNSGCWFLFGQIFKRCFFGGGVRVAACRWHHWKIGRNRNLHEFLIIQWLPRFQKHRGWVALCQHGQADDWRCNWTDSGLPGTKNRERNKKNTHYHTKM